ncbi:secreted RxLR effector protein 161-like [Capsicum annuum]|uniref:secreted RxLR effector protein 161-like n=1 Tax=Capsicum annuum TaxID=4072 RepID=UPI0007BFDF64|nr:secreted RxLR effector protein 161-like [Capsicum annuum]
METGMLARKPIETPVETNHRLANSSTKKIKDVGRYQRLVGKFIYLTHTRPDIAYVVSVVSQFMQNPTKDHMEAVYRILRYLKRAPGKGFLFSQNEKTIIKGYTDADWIEDQLTRKSTAGCLTFVEGNLITWRSKKQKVVARSSAEAGFRGMANGLSELLWIKYVPKVLGIEYTGPMNLFCDNKAAIQ